MIFNAGLSSLGVPGVPWHTQIWADQLTLFETRGTDYAHLITTSTPGFSDLPTALYYRHYLHCQLKICAPPQAIGKTMSYKEFTKKKELQSE